MPVNPFMVDAPSVTLPTAPSALSCPLCGSDMALRTRKSDGEKFWGCTDYPNCKGVRRYVETPAVPDKPFVPSHYQKDIFAWVKDGAGHAVIEAVAGSGKSTTGVKALELTPSSARVAFVAFNRHIAKELSRRAPEHVYTSTCHSLGLANITATLGQEVQVNEFKTNNLLDTLLNQWSFTKPAWAEAIREDSSAVVKLVALCKGTLLHPTPENLDWLSERYSLITNGSSEPIYEATKLVFDQSTAMTNVIDYEDMIYFSATGTVPCQQFDYLFVDEIQDLNKAQIQLVLNSIRKDGRVMGLGDSKQAIYGFRGADTEAMANVISALHATTLPLSITYRCPRSHVRLAQALVPQIEAAPNAGEGTVNTIHANRLYSLLRPGDLVICRTNAPLVPAAFDMIRHGKKAQIRGRDVGKGLLGLLHKVAKRRGVQGASLQVLLRELGRYVSAEASKMILAKKGSQAQALQDQYETIFALSDGCPSVEALEQRVETIFADNVQGIVFSSVHRAKGDEANRVFILHPELMPHPMASQPWELQQEQNIKYISYTRAKQDLYLVEYPSR